MRKLSAKEHSREKRKFSKLVIDQYKTLNRSVGPSKFAQDFRRLRDFAEAIFFGIGDKTVESVTVKDIQEALREIGGSYDLYRQQLEYVGNLAISALQGKPAEHFQGVDITCSVCGGHYHLETDHYECSGCGYIGKADQHGFPVSVPASDRVKSLRHLFHRRVKELYASCYTQEECYMLVAYQTNTPLPLVHAGLVTSAELLLDMIHVCNETIIHTKPVMAA